MVSTKTNNKMYLPLSKLKNIGYEHSSNNRDRSKFVLLQSQLQLQSQLRSSLQNHTRRSMNKTPLGILLRKERQSLAISSPPAWKVEYIGLNHLVTTAFYLIPCYTGKVWYLFTWNRNVPSVNYLLRRWTFSPRVLIHFDVLRW